MAIDVRLLTPFLAVAERLSFTRAADALNVSQPRLSLLIKKLEEQVGFPLFIRKPHHVQLTPTGEDLYREALRFEEALKRLDHAVGRLRVAARTKLRIGSPSSSRETPAREKLLNEFSVQHPSLSLDIVDGYTPRLLEQLREGKLDLTFAMASVPFNQTNLDCVLVSTSTPVLAIPEEDPRAALPFIDAAALNGSKIAVFPHYIGTAYVEAWYRPLEAAGAILTQSNEPYYATQLPFAARRRLSTILHRWPGELQEPNAGYPDMVLRPIVGFPLASRLFVVRRAGNQLPAVEWFWSLANTLSDEALGGRPAPRDSGAA